MRWTIRRKLTVAFLEAAMFALLMGIVAMYLIVLTNNAMRDVAAKSEVLALLGEIQSELMRQLSVGKDYIFMDDLRCKKEYSKYSRNSDYLIQQLCSPDRVGGHKYRELAEKLKRGKEDLEKVFAQAIALHEKGNNKRAIALLMTAEDGKFRDIYDQIRKGIIDMDNAVQQRFKEARQKSLTAQIVILITIVILVMLGVIFGNVFTRMITKPLNQLGHSAKEVAKGNLNSRVEVNSQDEIGELSALFNQMIEELKEARSEVEDYRKTLEQKVHQRTIELEEMQEKLKVGNKLLTEQATKLMYANRELERLRLYNDNIQQSMSSHLIVTDKNYKIRTWNHAAKAVWGLRTSEVIGKKLSELNANSQMEQLKEAVQDVMETGEIREIMGVEYHDLQNEQKYVDISCVPLINNEGKIRGVISIGDDATARVMLERDLENRAKELEEAVRQRTRKIQDMQEQLIRQEKLATLGQLAASVSHELRNPLSVLRTSAYYLKSKLTNSDDRIKNHLARIEDNVAVANKIITDLLDFSKVKEPIRQPINLNATVSQAISECRTRGTDETFLAPEVHTELDEEIPDVMGDELQLKQVIINLINNAKDAISQDGRITVETSRVSDNTVRITVTDTGQGILEEDLGKIFEPLFTTKAVGIGLGLPLCKSIIEAHGGSIKVESEPCVKTVFSVELPVNSFGCRNQSDADV